MLSPKVKGLLEGFVTGSVAASLVYTIALQAGYVVSASGAGLIVDDKIRPIQSTVDTILVMSLESRMRDLTREQCAAGPSLQGVLQNEIDRLQRQHHDLTKTYYSITVRCV